MQVHPATEMIVDTGYQGIQKIHAQTKKPQKGSKKKPLTPEEKKVNQQHLNKEKYVGTHRYILLKKK